MNTSKAEPICYKRVRISRKGSLTIIKIPKEAGALLRNGRRLFFYKSGVNRNAKPILPEWKEAGVIAVYGRFDEERRGHWQIKPVEGDLLQKAIALVRQAT